MYSTAHRSRYTRTECPDAQTFRILPILSPTFNGCTRVAFRLLSTTPALPSLTPVGTSRTVLLLTWGLPQSTPSPCRRRAKMSTTEGLRFSMVREEDLSILGFQLIRETK